MCGDGAASASSGDLPEGWDAWLSDWQQHEGDWQDEVRAWSRSMTIGVGATLIRERLVVANDKKLDLRQGLGGAYLEKDASQHHEQM